jgi:glucose/arabinose dehydrogenase
MVAGRRDTCQHATMHRSSRRLRAIAVLLVATVAAALASTAPVHAGDSAPTPAFRLAEVRGVSFTAPLWVGGAPGSGSTVYVAEQGGLVWAVNGTRKSRFLDVRSLVQSGGEQGLLSLAFAHDYATSGLLYVYYVARDGRGEVRQFRAVDGRVVAGSGRSIIRIQLDPPVATNHNGGNLWSTRGGFLFLSIGDGGGGGVEVRNSQRMDRLMGKLIRIVPRTSGGGYVIPRSNPFYGREGARREIFALGLRNPWRFSIDGATGDIWIGDVGQGEVEEIDRLQGGSPAGANFGWPRHEGTRLFSGDVTLASGTTHKPPFLQYGRDGGQCSVTGGVVYRGPVTSLRGRYLYADFCTDKVWSVSPATRGIVEHDGAGGIVHFGSASGGNVYAASVTGGKIYRIVAP